MYIKSFDEWTLQDNFIFQQVMLKKHICKAVLERLLDISIKDIVYIHEEKNLDVRWDTKSVRLDVFVNDDKGTVLSKPLQAFLDYIDGQEATDELLRDIDDAVYEVKHCEAWKEEYVMLSMDHYKYWKEGMAEGIAEGLAQGKAEGKIEVVIQMLRKQLSLEMIAEVTNFTVEDVRKIAEEHALM